MTNIDLIEEINGSFDDSEIDSFCFLPDEYACAVIALYPDNRIVYNLTRVLLLYCKKHNIDRQKLSEDDVFDILYNKLGPLRVPPVFMRLDSDPRIHRMGYTIDGFTIFDYNGIKIDYDITNHIEGSAESRRMFNEEVLPNYLSC